MSDQIYFMEQTIRHLTEQFLGIHHDPILKHGDWNGKIRNAMLFRGYMEVELPYNHPYHKRIEFSERPKMHRNFEIIITERHNVFVNWNQHHRLFGSTVLTPSDFVNTGNHDSCWCSMGYTKMDHNFQEMYEELNALLKTKRYKEPVPAQMQITMHLGSFLGEDPIRFCEVEVAQHEGAMYILDLKSITPKKVTMEFVNEIKTV